MSDDGIRARLDAFENHLRDFARLLLHIHDRNAPMSAPTDALQSGATTIASTVSDNATKTTTLIGYKDEDTSALTSLTGTLSTASDSLKATGAALDAAIAAHKAGSTDAPASTTVTVSAPVTAPATVLPIDTDTIVPAGSTVSGPGIAAGTTVSSSTATTVTLDTPTTADDVGDGSESLTVTPAAS